MGVLKTIAVKLLLANLPALAPYLAASLPILRAKAAEWLQAKAVAIQARDGAASQADVWRLLGILLAQAVVNDAAFFAGLQAVAAAVAAKMQEQATDAASKPTAAKS